MARILTKIIGTGLGSGYAPFAPGTVGSLVGLAVWLILPSMTALQQAALIAVGFFIGVPVCTSLEAEYGHDPHQATYDEVVGQWVALFMLPRTLPYIAASFLIFRALDVWKPFPARVSQKLRGGWGIMVDDLIVAIYTCGLLQVVRWVFIIV